MFLDTLDVASSATKKSNGPTCETCVTVVLSAFKLTVTEILLPAVEKKAGVFGWRVLDFERIDVHGNFFGDPTRLFGETPGRKRAVLIWLGWSQEKLSHFCVLRIMTTK